MTALPGQTKSKLIRFPLDRLFGWAIVALLILATGWLYFRNRSLQTENKALLTERQLIEVAYKTAQIQLAERSLLAESMINDLGSRLRRSGDLARLKVSVLAPLAGSTENALAIAVWDPDQQAGLLTIDRMSATADSQDYQIWIVDPVNPNPVSGGVFHVSKDGQIALAFKPAQPVHRAAAFAISLEQNGGAPKSEGPIVLFGKIPEI